MSINMTGFVQRAMHPKFELYIHPEDKVFLSITRGHFGPEDGEAAMTEYTNIVNSIDTTEYTFMIECKEMDANSPEMFAVLVGFMKFYGEANYKKVQILESKSRVTTAQLKRAIKESGADIELIKSY